MNFRYKYIVLIFCLLVLLVPPASGLCRIKLGVLSKSGSTACLNRWSALGLYLAEELGEQVYILPLDFDAVEQVVQDGKIDFLLANPNFFVSVQQDFNARAIATLQVARKDRPLRQFAGVIFVLKESAINSVSEMKGRGFMVVDFSSFGGCLMAYRLLLETGIDPLNDLSTFIEGITHENVVSAVAKGLIEVGTVRTGVLEDMQDKGKIHLNDFRILNVVDDGFPLVHSTRLYPEWPMVALAHVSDKKVRKMQKALLSLKASDPASIQAGIIGWQPVMSYAPIRDVIEIIENNRH